MLHKTVTKISQVNVYDFYRNRFDSLYIKISLLFYMILLKVMQTSKLFGEKLKL